MSPDIQNKLDQFLKPNMIEGTGEKRTWPRHDTAIPVSIRCCKETNNKAAWHIGEAVNISVDGLAIRMDPLPDAMVSSLVKLFCLPKLNALPPGILDPEPVWITGEVIWMDKTENILGLKVIS